MGTSFLDYQSAKAEKQAEEHQDHNATCFSTAAVPRRSSEGHSLGTKDKGAASRAGMERFLNGTIIVTFMRELLKCMGEFLSKPM